MDLNQEYAAHQQALMHAASAGSHDERLGHQAAASSIAERISAFQRGLGAAAACAWSMAQVAGSALPTRRGPLC